MRSGNLVGVPSVAVEEPEILRGFALLSRLGTGGMAELFAARPRGPSNLPPLFALKRMLPADACRPEFVAMFVDEAKVVARLDHPNIVRSYEYGQHAGLYYIAMELVRGLDLRRVQMLLSKKDERIPMGLSVWIVEQVCEALAHAHAVADDEGRPINLIHRDITPHNLMLAFDGSVKVVDFGIAKTALQSTATRVGTLKGKVHYMTPEQARGERVDHTCDLYAASICLWELLAGREAFERDETYIGALQRAQDPQIPPIRTLRDDVPEELGAILEKGLARRKEDRFQKASDMATALEAVRTKLGTGGQLGLARWLRGRFARIREAQNRVLSHVAPLDGTAAGVDVEASTIRGVAIGATRDASVSDPAAEGTSAGLGRDGTEVFFSVDIDVELPTNLERTLPYAPLIAADPWVNAAPTEVDVPPGFSLEELWVAFGSETGDSDAEMEIPIEHDIPGAETTPRAPVAPRTTDRPEAPRSRSGLVVGAAVVIAAAIIGAAFYLGPFGRPTGGRLEIAAEVDSPLHVTVDGVRTRATIDSLPAGRHEVSVGAEGYETIVRTVEVGAGATTVVAVELRPVDAIRIDEAHDVVAPGRSIDEPTGVTPDEAVPDETVDRPENLAAPVQRAPPPRAPRPRPRVTTMATIMTPTPRDPSEAPDEPVSAMTDETAPVAPTMTTATTPATPTMAEAAPSHATPSMAAPAPSTPSMASTTAPSMTGSSEAGAEPAPSP